MANLTRDKVLAQFDALQKDGELLYAPSEVISIKDQGLDVSIRCIPLNSDTWKMPRLLSIARKNFPAEVVTYHVSFLGRKPLGLETSTSPFIYLVLARLLLYA